LPDKNKEVSARNTEKNIYKHTALSSNTFNKLKTRHAHHHKVYKEGRAADQRKSVNLSLDMWQILQCSVCLVVY